MPKIVYLPCLDSPELAAQGKRELYMERDKAAALGHSAVQISRDGGYQNGKREHVDIGSLVQTAVRRKASIPPDAVLAQSGQRFDETRIQVSNETTLNAGYRLLKTSAKVLALNFANGIAAGGGFLHGARAQEECLCRSSSLYLTLAGDPMYGSHARRPSPDSTDWAILSPDVPVFRLDDGTALDSPYLLSFITCAAPYAPTVGKARSAELMKHRIHRVLEIARSYGYESLVLGAWGCGAFGNDPVATARQFKDALSGDFEGAFAEVVFAIVDWSPDRRLLGVFRDAFTA